MNRSAVRWAALALAVACACLICFFSSEDGGQSGARSRWVIEAVARAVHPDYDAWSASNQHALVERWQTPVRKAGHMAEFALLGLFLGVFGRTSGWRRWWIWALMGALAVAAADETHQMFVSGRGPSAVDVCIDMAGAGIGVLTVRLIRGRFCDTMAGRGGRDG